MADPELNLISAVVNDGDLTAVINAGVDLTFFEDDEHNDVYSFIVDHWQSYGKVPGRGALRARFRNYEVRETPEPIGYYIEELREKRRYAILALHVGRASAELKDGDDLDYVMREISQAMSEAHTVTSRLVDHDLNDPEVFDAAVQEYRDRRRTKDKLRGLSTGFPTIDLATMGAQPGQFITLVGPPKAGKTTVWTKVGHEFSLEVPTLALSFEMPFYELQARYMALLGRTNYRRLIKGGMTEKDERYFRKARKLLEEHESLVLSEDIMSATTVSGVLAKIQQYKPGAVLIDGVYLMDDEYGEPKGSSQALTNITRGLKRLALTQNIPIVGTTQALLSKMRGGRVGQSSIGYTSSFGQDSDTVIAVELRNDPEDDSMMEHWLRVIFSRQGPMAEVELEFDFEISSFIELDGAGEEADDYDDQDHRPDLDDDGRIIGTARRGREEMQALRD